MFKESKLPYGTKEGFLYGLIKPLSNAATCIMIVFLSSKKDHTSSNLHRKRLIRQKNNLRPVDFSSQSLSEASEETAL